MRIAHVITRFIPGGADENTLLTCNHQARSGHEVILISGQTWSGEIRKDLDPLVRFTVVPSLRREISPLNDAMALIQLTRMFNRVRPDVVHTHTSKAGILGRLAARIASCNRIIHGVHILPFSGIHGATTAIYELSERICGSFTDAFVHVSPALMKDCLDRGIGASSLHAVALSGMNITRYQNAAPPDDVEFFLKSPVGDAQKPIILLNVGALEPRKGQRKFLPVFKALVDECPNLVLLLAGDGSDRRKIAQEIDDFGLINHVRLLGHRSDVDRLLAIADIALTCSEHEGLPRTVVQAAIAGVPIVTTSLPGIEILIDHGKTGMIVPVGAYQAMGSALLRLIRNDELRSHMRDELTRGDYTAWATDSMLHKIDEVYRTIHERA